MALFNYGTFEGTGAALAVNVGFLPDYIKIMNIDGNCQLEWSRSATASAYGQKIYDEGTTETGIATITTGGITVGGVGGNTVGATEAQKAVLGFGLGADTDINVSGQTCWWIALAKG